MTVKLILGKRETLTTPPSFSGQQDSGLVRVRNTYFPPGLDAVAASGQLCYGGKSGGADVSGAPRERLWQEQGPASQPPHGTVRHRTRVGCWGRVVLCSTDSSMKGL